jgi:hypothetical protein
VVETGTATFYKALSRISPEPVLARLAARIGNDEQRHYNLLSYHYRRWAEAEGTGRRAVLATLHARLGELDREDIYIAMKHVFRTLHPDRPFTPADYRATRDHYARLARRHYPYRTAARMLIEPLRLSPIVASAATPLLAATGWLLAA